VSPCAEACRVQIRNTLGFPMWVGDAIARGLAVTILGFLRLVGGRKAGAYTRSHFSST